jgi:hypothetical protein
METELRLGYDSNSEPLPSREMVFRAMLGCQTLHGVFFPAARLYHIVRREILARPALDTWPHIAVTSLTLVGCPTAAKVGDRNPKVNALARRRRHQRGMGLEVDFAAREVFRTDLAGHAAASEPFFAINHNFDTFNLTRPVYRLISK